MLYDPKWEHQTKAGPLTLNALIAWLEKQPGDETYCYTSIGDCLLAKYFKHHGFSDVLVAPFWFCDGASDKMPYPKSFNEVAIGSPRTFAAALSRARKIQSR